MTTKRGHPSRRHARIQKCIRRFVPGRGICCYDSRCRVEKTPLESKTQWLPMPLPRERSSPPLIVGVPLGVLVVLQSLRSNNTCACVVLTVCDSSKADEKARELPAGALFGRFGPRGTRQALRARGRRRDPRHSTARESMRGAMCAANVAIPSLGMARGTSARVVSTCAPDAVARARAVSRPSAVSSLASRDADDDARGGTPRVLSDGYKRALAMWRAGAIDDAVEAFGTLARPPVLLPPPTHVADPRSPATRTRGAPHRRAPRRAGVAQLRADGQTPARGRRRATPPRS